MLIVNVIEQAPLSPCVINLQKRGKQTPETPTYHEIYKSTLVSDESLRILVRKQV